MLQTHPIIPLSTSSLAQVNVADSVLNLTIRQSFSILAFPHLLLLIRFFVLLCICTTSYCDHRNLNLTFFIIRLQHIYVTQSPFLSAIRGIHNIVNIIHSSLYCIRATVSSLRWIAINGQKYQYLSPGLKSRHLAFLSYHHFIQCCADFRFFCANSFAFLSLSCISDTCIQTLFSESSSNQHSLRSFKGPQGRCPKTSSKGLNPKDSWMDSLAANNKRGIHSSQSFPSVVQ